MVVHHGGIIWSFARQVCKGEARDQDIVLDDDTGHAIGHTIHSMGFIMAIDVQPIFIGGNCE